MQSGENINNVTVVYHITAFLVLYLRVGIGDETSKIAEKVKEYD